MDHDKPPIEIKTNIITGTEEEKPLNIIAASILVGAILISASILYGFHSISSGGAVLGQQQNAPAAPTAAANGNAQPGAIVTVSDRNDEPTLGNKDAKVVVEEFGDFQCPFCKNFFQQTFDQIKKQYIDTGKIKYVFRHFPLTNLHINAQISAVAAECANQQGKFWDYHNVLYTSGQADGTGLDKASLEKYASQLGLGNKFNQCLESNATLATVQADQSEGTKDGITGTPSFIINGKLIVGAQPFSAFQTAIDAALQN